MSDKEIKEEYSVYDIVCKLIGPIEPLGCSSRDNERLVNANKLCDLVNSLLGDIDRCATANKDRHEASVQEIGQTCDSFLDLIGIPKD